MKAFPSLSFIHLIPDLSATGCTASPSVLDSHGSDAAMTASLTRLMFAISIVVLNVVGTLLWMTYRPSRLDTDEENLYANDETVLRNVLLGGGLVPILVRLVIMALGIGVENTVNADCVYCHTIEGSSATGHAGPDLTHLASRKAIGSGILPNNLGNLAGRMINSQTIKPGNHTPPMNLNADQLQARLAYPATLK